MTPEENVVAATKAGVALRRARADARHRPRLLVVGPLPPPFIGPAVATRRLLDSAVLARHFEIEFVNTGDPEGFDDIGRFGWHNVSMALRHGAACLGVLVRRRPAAVYVPIARGIWGFVRDLLFIIPARMLGTRVIVHLRAGRFDLIHDNGRIGRALARFGLAFVDRALVLGETVRGVYGSAVSAARVAVVPNGVQLEGWNAEEWAAARTTLSSGTVRVAYIANLFHDKGIHVMLAAIALLRECSGERITVTFAGDWGNAGYRDECLRMVRDSDLEDRVEFIGRVDEEGKRALLAASDIAAFVPVKPEGLPWVVIEAMAAALPVIGTPQGTIPELIIDGESGYLVPVEDAEALAAHIAELAADPPRRAAMGRKGRERVEEIYSEEKTHERLAVEVLGSLKSKVKRQKAKGRN
jgi:glycosyltransferase involved in cell wall biosynthesis